MAEASRSSTRNELRAISAGAFLWRTSTSHRARTMRSPNTGAPAARPAGRCSTRAHSDDIRYVHGRGLPPRTYPDRRRQTGVMWCTISYAARHSPGRATCQRPASVQPMGDRRELGRRRRDRAPSALQIELLDQMRPTAWMGMSQLCASTSPTWRRRSGIDLAGGLGRRSCSAPPSRSRMPSAPSSRACGWSADHVRQFRHDRDAP